MRNFLLLYFLPLFLFTALCGCRVEDQTIIPPEHNLKANPAPLDLPFSEVNRRHKVLLAVIGTGVDYRNELLAKNIHYQLDRTGKVLGTGFDFIGTDHWPAPYFVRTDYFNSKISKELQAKSARMLEATKTVNNLLNKLFNKELDPFRLIELESANQSWHETHVAALMAFDDPALGILPYRTYPAAKEIQDGVELSYLESNLNTIDRALAKAAQDGARVVNISLGVFRKSSESEYKLLKKFQQRFESFAKSHPNMAFVSAAGNERGVVVDDENTLAIPCGVRAPNWICVGAIDRTGQIASFSNVNSKDFRFALTFGTDIKSVFPADTYLKLGDFDAVAPDTYEKMAYIKVLHEKIASSSLQFLTVDGTSQSAPLVAREIAREIKTNLALSGEEAIDRVLEKGTPYSEENGHWIVLNKIALPNW